LISSRVSHRVQAANIIRAPETLVKYNSRLFNVFGRSFSVRISEIRKSILPLLCHGKDQGGPAAIMFDRSCVFTCCKCNSDRNASTTIDIGLCGNCRRLPYPGSCHIRFSFVPASLRSFLLSRTSRFHSRRTREDN